MGQAHTTRGHKSDKGHKTCNEGHKTSNQKGMVRVMVSVIVSVMLANTVGATRG